MLYTKFVNSVGVKKVYCSYNRYMKVNNAREVVKLLLMQNNMSITKLAELMTTENKKMYQQTLSAKLINGTLKYNEMVKICNILGYEIEFKKIV